MLCCSESTPELHLEVTVAPEGQNVHFLQSWSLRGQGHADSSLSALTAGIT
jgi:hypothetical protein